MQQQAVYDLCIATPHEPAAERFTAREFAVYQAGYVMALRMALRVMEAAVRRYSLVTRTRRLEAKLKREAERA